MRKCVSSRVGLVAACFFAFLFLTCVTAASDDLSVGHLPIVSARVAYDGNLLVEDDPTPDDQLIVDNGSLRLRYAGIDLTVVPVSVDGAVVWYVESLIVDRADLELTTYRFMTVPHETRSTNNPSAQRFEIQIVVNWSRPLDIAVEYEGEILLDPPSLETRVGLNFVPFRNNAVWRFESDQYSYAFLRLPGSWEYQEDTGNFSIPDLGLSVLFHEMTERAYGQGDEYVGYADLVADGAFRGWEGANSTGKSNRGSYTVAGSARKSVAENKAVAWLEINPNSALPLLVYMPGELDVVLENSGEIYSLLQSVEYLRTR